jgi:hypothetical protein
MLFGPKWKYKNKKLKKRNKKKNDLHVALQPKNSCKTNKTHNKL